MNDQQYPWYITGVLDFTEDKEVAGLEYLYKKPASDCVTPGENLIMMVSKLIHMSKMLSIYVTTDDMSTVEPCQRLAEEIHLHEKLATDGLYDLPPTISGNVFKMIFPFPSRMERVSLSFENILKSWHTKTAEGIPVSDKAREELVEILDVVIEMLESLRDVLLRPDRFILEQMKFQGERLMQLVEDARCANWERLEARVCRPQRASVYVDVLDSFRNLNGYVSKMRDSVLNLMLESEVSEGAEKRD